ncbi:MAG: C25 family cysteine peptidase [Bacteroidota bacterium]|nr:C25 family cysteine peptidase [Bacteroidota bacterium]
MRSSNYNTGISLKLCLFFICLQVFNTHFLNSQNVISIITNEDGFIIDFTLPSYQVTDTNIYEAYGINQDYSFIDIEYSGEMVDSGYPNLPQYTFDLHIPDDATTFNVSVSNKQTSTQYLTNKILPAQDVYKDDSLVFAYDTGYYASNGALFLFDYQISDTFDIMGANGIGFSIFPFHYNPGADSLEITQSCRFTITHNGSSSLLLKPDSANSAVKNHYLGNVFENYPTPKNSPVNMGKYLIITDPAFESTLLYFANYKRNIGYDVTVVTTTVTGSTTYDIKDYLQLQYNNISTRPDYVLLVGDQSDIPASGGNIMGDVKNDPITDLNYARLGGSDYFADVFLGRFSVSSIPELQNIINKIIYMETNIHLFDKKAKFLAGEESSNWMENQFENGHEYVIEETFDPEGYTCQKLYQPNDADAIAAISDNPLFYIYSGHGSFTDMAGGSFSIDYSAINSATNTVFPFVFSFACKTGNFAHPSYTCIGERWIRNSIGGVAYFGSSVNTMANSDKAIEKKIFGDAFTDEEQISAIINLGMKRYWSRFWSFWNRKRTKRYMKAYNLLGDPSINILGTGCISDFIFTENEVFNNGDIITYHASNNIENSAGFKVNNGAEVTLLAGNSIVLNPGLSVTAGASFKAAIEPCDNGTTSKSATIDTEINNITVLQPDFQTKIIDPAIFSLFPNPTNSEFSISYAIDKTSSISFELYSISGNKVTTFLAIDRQEPGNYYYNFSLSGFNAGCYLYILKTKSKTYSGQIIKN